MITYRHQSWEENECQHAEESRLTADLIASGKKTAWEIQQENSLFSWTPRSQSIGPIFRSVLNALMPEERPATAFSDVADVVSVKTEDQPSMVIHIA